MDLIDVICDEIEPEEEVLVLFVLAHDSVSLLPLKGRHYEQGRSVVDASQPHHVARVVELPLPLDLFEDLGALLPMESPLEVVQDGELSANRVFESRWLGKQEGVSGHFINDVLKEGDLLMILLALEVSLVPINEILPLHLAFFRGDSTFLF